MTKPRDKAALTQGWYVMRLELRVALIVFTLFCVAMAVFIVSNATRAAESLLVLLVACTLWFFLLQKRLPLYLVLGNDSLVVRSLLGSTVGEVPESELFGEALERFRIRSSGRTHPVLVADPLYWANLLSAQVAAELVHAIQTRQGAGERKR